MTDEGIPICSQFSTAFGDMVSNDDPDPDPDLLDVDDEDLTDENPARRRRNL